MLAARLDRGAPVRGRWLRRPPRCRQAGGAPILQDAEDAEPACRRGRGERGPAEGSAAPLL